MPTGGSFSMPTGGRYECRGGVANLAGLHTEGEGSGESFAQFPIRAGDHVVADRGYSTARGIGHVADAGGQLIVRVNTGALPLRTVSGEPFNLLAAVTSLRHVGVAMSWSAQVVVDGDTGQPSRMVAGRVCGRAQVCGGRQDGAAQNPSGGNPQGQAGATGHPEVRRVT